MKRVVDSKIVSLLFVAWLAAGCSAGSVVTGSTELGQQTIYTAPPATTPTGTTTPTPTPTSTPGTGIAPYTMRVGTVGYNSTTVQISTRSILKVTFAPGVQDQTVAGTGFEPAYGHLGVYIQVGSSSQPTPMLSNGLLDGNPETSPVLDFSSAFTPTCAATDTTCHQPITITITKPNNDYYCMNFGLYCAWAQVYSTHPWHGTLSIQTDDTNPLPTN
jgi:hypothetical protein